MTLQTEPATQAAQQIAGLDADQRQRLLHRLRTRLDDGRPTAPPHHPWIWGGTDRPQARARLFCFSYAGAGASIFRRWLRPGALPAEVDICPIQLPGRENRVAERPYRRIETLVDDLVPALDPWLDRPFVFFGHSMGALVAFELARRLRALRRPQPAHLLLGAFRAPQRPNPNIRIHHLPDEVLKTVLAKEGTPQQVLQSDELMSAMLPTLRADLELCDHYQYRPEPPLAMPVSVFGGDTDVRVRPAALDGWHQHTVGRYDLTILPGSHFFIHGAEHQLLGAVARRLIEHTGAVA